MTRHVWTAEEDRTLSAIYPEHSASVCATVLQLGKDQVLRRAHRLGLHKSGEWIAAHARRVSERPHHGGRATRFTKGLVPWNKGKKGLSHPGSVATQFKPGTRPQTLRPIGYEVVRDGQLWRKVSDRTDRPARFNFVAVTRLVWEAAHGPVPAGHVVAFKPGLDTTIAAEITLERLELASRADMARRNSWHHYPPDLKSAIRQLGKLKRTIRESHEEQDQRPAKPPVCHPRGAAG